MDKSQEIHNMEDMELESIVDVPDTPDRPMSRCYIDGKGIDNMNGKHKNELVRSKFSVANNGNNRRLDHTERICCRNEVKIGNNTVPNSPLKKLHDPHGALLFRRALTENVRESRPPQLAEKKGKCKAICNNTALELSCAGKISLLDLTEDKEESLKTKPAIPFHRQEDFSTIKSTRTKLSKRCNFTHSNFSSSASSSCSTTTPDMTISNDSESSNRAICRGEMLDLSSCSPIKINLQNPLSFANRSSISQKRLVQNGCTFQPNIASRAKQSAENYADTAHDSKEEIGTSAISSNVHLLDMNDIVADEKRSYKVKGKGLPIHQSTSSGNKAGAVSVRRNSSGCFGDQGSWRTTSRHLRNPNWSMQNGMWHPSRMNDDIGCLSDMQQWNRRDENVIESRQKNKVVCIPDDVALSTSETLSKTDRVTESALVGNALTKRQRKQGMMSRNLLESSSSVSRDSDVIALGLPGELSNPRSSESQQFLGNWDAEVVPLSSDNKETIYLESDGEHNEELDARARQLEADEKFALELQQQLYYETDEYSTWNLPEEEAFHNIGPSMLPQQRMPGQSNEQSQLRNNERSRDRRRARSQVFIPNRVAPSRSRIVIQSPPMLSDTMRFSFPLDMNLDMRLDILEALEAAAGEFGDMGMADNVFNVQRNFNENDYEMLLALDENNHQHAGATATQISSLPQSKVKTTSVEELCAICLETPTVGDTIRHLPCLHKFHKDCIDPWLRRKTSCPVCKSSIT